MQNLLEATAEVRGICEGSAYALDSLAHSFRAVGNEVVASKLDNMAEKLSWAADRIKKGVNDSIYEQVRASEQSAFNVLQAALAGIEIGTSS